MKHKISILALLLSFNASICLANSGGTKRSGPFVGCHNNRSQGGFHCHSKSFFPRQSWASEAKAYEWLGEKKDKDGNFSRTPNGGPEFYDRSSWGGWKDLDNDCLNTRHEVLLRDSIIPVIRSKDGCKIIKGEWLDFYTGEKIKKTSQIEVDHVVPVAKAHQYSKAQWNSQKRRAFFNDLDNLVLTTKSTNASKGSNDFTTWMPKDRNRACVYAEKWFSIKTKYKFEVSDREKESKNLLECDEEKRKTENVKTSARLPEKIVKLASIQSDKVEVRVFNYQGQTVYFIPSAKCCDHYDNVYDKSGKKLCAPQGGFTGAGDGKCPQFFKTAQPL